MLTSELEEVIAEVGDGLSAHASLERISFALADGRRETLELFERRSITPSSAHRLIEHHPGPGMVVADLIDSSAIELLQTNAWSFWDRRGRIRIWLPEIGYRLDLPTRSFATGADGPDRRHPVTGVGGRSIALSLLIDVESAGIRTVAKQASMAPSTISRARQHLVDASLINPDGTPLVPELFWATSDSWVPKPVPVDRQPDGDDWVLAGDAAAAHWGAPTFANRQRYYCTSQQVMSRFVHTHRADDESPIDVAVAPTPLVNATARDGIAHPVVAALDLSRSQRGREILQDWSRFTLDAGHPNIEPVWQ